QTVKARMSAASAKGGQPIADTIDYLWRLVRSATGQRLSGALTARIANGEAVTVGDVILDRNGMRHAKKRSAPLLAWSSVADPRIEGRNVVIPGVGIKGIVVPLGAMDTFLLFEAVPELRALFGD
ncbi:MAG: hypothetical protein QOD43_497, partial [Gaiellaceae bacterium]|nr:hypothetical protein [Gaiellaceae bacterium]